MKTNIIMPTNYRKTLLFLAAFFLISTCMSLIFSHTTNAMTASKRKTDIQRTGRCGGITSGNRHGYAGLVVVFAVQPDGTEQRTALTSNSQPVRAEVSTYGVTRTPAGNIYNTGTGARQTSKWFDPNGSGACSGAAVLPGHGGGWAVDCDTSLRGAGNYQPVKIEGAGVPTGYRSGGEWSSEIVRPSNGNTFVVVITYEEPPEEPSSTTWKLNGHSNLQTSNTIYAAENNSVNIRHKVYRFGSATGSINTWVTGRAVLYDKNDDVKRGSEYPDGAVYKKYESWNIPRSASGTDPPGLEFDSQSSNDNTGYDGRYVSQQSPIKQWASALERGNHYCEWLRVKPRNSNNPNSVQNTKKQCVRIIGEWTSDSKQQIKRTKTSGIDSRSNTTVVSDTSGNAEYNEARVGEKYSLSHDLRNNGPSATQDPVYVETTWNGFWTKVDEGVSSGARIGGPYTRETNQLVPSDASDTASTCSRIHWRPGGSNYDRYQSVTVYDTEKYSNNSCVRVPYYYEVNPSVTTTGSDTLEQGKKVDFSGYGNIPIKTGDRYNTNSRNATWTFAKRVLDKDGNLIDSGNVASGSKVFSPQNGESDSNKLSDHSIDTAAYPVGTKVCIGLTITQANHGGATKSAPEKCVDIVKSPKVQFQNADVRVGRNFRNNNDCTTNPDAKIEATGVTAWAPNNATRNMYGSWVEYGAFAASTITGFGSAATPTGVSWTSDPPNKLTFANTTAANLVSGGGFQFNSQCQPDYFGRVDGDEDKKDAIKDSTPGGDVDVNLADGDIQNGKYVINGKNINISGNIPAGKDITVYAKKDGSNGGKVTITGNIEYPDDASAQNIPRLIILADDGITINENVQRVDAWLITKTTLNTCNKTNNLVEGDCAERLIINGPVSVGKLGLYRTYGSDSTKPETHGKAAEVFNLRPDQILTQYFKENGPGAKQKATSVYEVELPPRY